MSQPQRTIGSYQLLERLGRGGMGVVYLAVDPSGRRVALKTVRVPDEWLLHSIRREIHALAGIRHPGIVRILDEGVDRGLPWYAMELIDSQPLDRHCRRRQDPPAAEPATPPFATDTQELSAEPQQWWTGSLGPATGPLGPPEPGPATPAQPPREAPAPDLLEVLTLVRRLCAPLAYLHGEGIVHRDLKPENVLVRQGGWPVLVDFGLISHFAAARGREALELGAEAVGTVAYMAPEQARGAFVDARADLYSLGCILYELLAGRPPFVGKNPGQVLAQHLRAEPVPPSKLAPGLPAELDAVVLRLLAKNPRERFGHADDVAAALEALGAGSGPAAAGPRPRSYLYRPGLVGRQGLLEQLAQLLEGLKRGSGGLVLLGGESGAGKTRLLMQLGSLARAQVLVLAGECLDVAARPLEALRGPLQAVADRCRERGVEETERLLGRRGKLLARYEPALAGLPGQELHPEPAELPGEAERQRLFADLADTLQALAGDRPLLLLLDDLQWADDLVLGFLDSLRRATLRGRGSLLVVGTFRSEEAGPGLQELLAAEGVERFDVPRLDEAAVSAMIGEMLALERAPEGFVRYLARQSEGNPFFIAEYLRTAVGEGLLHRDRAGRWHAPEETEPPAAQEQEGFALPLPGTLRELVGWRLQRLGAAAHGLAEAACVLGREMPEALLARVAGLPPSESLGALRELLDRQVLQEAEAGRLRFVHDKIREVAAERIAPERRGRLHRAAAEALDALPGPERAAHLASLGHHWQQAGEPARARECYLAAARQAAARYAQAEAERLYRAHLALAGEPSEQDVEARLELATRVLVMRGRPDAARAELQLALQAALRLGARAAEAQILGALAAIHTDQGHLAEAHPLRERSLALARELGRLDLEASALGHLAQLHLYQGRLEEARELYARILHIARELGDRRLEGDIVSSAAHLAYLEGRLEESERLNRQALAIHVETGNRSSEALVLGKLGGLLRLQERAEAELVFVERALAIYREIGDRSGEGRLLSAQAGVQARLGEVERARQMFEQAAAIQGQQLPHHLARVLFDRALLERRTGRLEEAERWLRQAESTFREFGDPLGVVVCRCAWGHLALARGGHAQPFLDEAERLARASQADRQAGFDHVIACLRESMEAAAAGQPLLHGEALDYVPEALQRWVARNARGA